VPDRLLDLEKEHLRAEEWWRGGADEHVPIDVAAGMAFVRVYGNTKAIRTRQDYDDALNIMGATLSRLIPVYALKDPREGRQPVAIDLANQAFVRGATRLRSCSGTSLARLTVLRPDLLSAVARLRRIALPLVLFLAGVPVTRAAAESFSPKANRLLAALPASDYARLAEHLELVPLRAQEPLFTEGTQRRYAYFPVSGVVSVLYITRDGASTEIGVIGNDGMAGLAVLLGGGSTPRRAVVQIPGFAYRVPAETIQAEFHRGEALQSLALRYVQALITQVAQAAVCNRRHSVEQQLCRWLLLSLDRISSNEVLMTQELLGHALGVRRSGITQAAKTLQEAGLIGHRRGRIIVPDRARLEAHACECYTIVKNEADRLLPPHAEIRTVLS